MKRGLAIVILALAGCKDEPGAQDAGDVPRKLVASDLGVEVMLPMGWIVEPVPTAPAASGAPTAMAPGDSVRTLARARRVPGDRPFLVAPKIVITAEVTAKKDPGDAFRATLADLKRLDDAPSVAVTRSALSTRFIGSEQVGDIELAYEVTAGDAPSQEIVHRSAVVLRRPATGSRAIVTVTATYLARDADMVGAEIQAIMNSLALRR